MSKTCIKTVVGASNFLQDHSKKFRGRITLATVHPIQFEFLMKNTGGYTLLLLHLKRHCSSTTTTTSFLSSYSTKDSQILQLCKDGSLRQALHLLNTHQATLNPNLKPVLYASLLQTCTKTSSFLHGTTLHAHAFKSGIQSDRFVGNSLLTLYLKLGPHLPEAQTLFDSLPVRDIIAWSSLISAYTRAGRPKNSIHLFSQMLGLSVEPNAFTLSAVITAASALGDLALGSCLHAVVISRGFHSNTVISSTLVGMYGRNRAVRDALRVFNESPEPDNIVGWTSIISTLTQNDMFKEALRVFITMHREHGLLPDGFTCGTLLAACANLGWLRQGKEMHGIIVGLGIYGNVVVDSSLLDMYGKCGEVAKARIVFDRLGNKNSVSWTAMLNVYCQNEDYEAVFELVRERGVADLYGFGTVLRACSGVAAVMLGKEVHCQYVRKSGWGDVIVESALVGLYAKCGCVDFASRLFMSMEFRNLITWNTMIDGLAQNGRGRVALELFENMIKEGMKPDYITFIGVLFACSHTGLVDEGRKYFALMVEEYRIRPRVEHYNCMVDLLGRAGMIEEAESLLENADCRYDRSLWEVLLGACTKCSDYVTAERVARKMIEREPDFHLSYVLLGNIYRAVGRWNDALEIRKLMEDRGVKKLAGKSWVGSENRKGSQFGLASVNVFGRSSVSSLEEAV